MHMYMYERRPVSGSALLSRDVSGSAAATVSSLRIGSYEAQRTRAATYKCSTVLTLDFCVRMSSSKSFVMLH
jgi:hypothetical protein